MYSEQFKFVDIIYGIYEKNKIKLRNNKMCANIWNWKYENKEKNKKEECKVYLKRRKNEKEKKIGKIKIDI